ncbi:brassinosteroid-responsive RING protein 1-like [Lycium barbarum]|uniref:brassinosteroid-responsive RING protein 1-like n=1 Tax=Lycium barbarum TaxID=112863 RepID=UPI00293E630E|nr:brassinosteroid-responsive RING protein 1-like [Lycium barbarum]
MGFPLGYTDFHFPKQLLHLLSLLGFIRKLICTLFTFMGLGDFFEPELPDPTRPEFPNPTWMCSVSAELIREILPVVKYSEIPDPTRPESCAVCLHEFGSDDEIRRLVNCCHVFHRSCVDRWMDHDYRMTCPLCRREFIPEGMMGIFNEKLWLASGINSGFYEEY